MENGTEWFIISPQTELQKGAVGMLSEGDTETQLQNYKIRYRECVVSGIQWLDEGHHAALKKKSYYL